MTLSLDPNTPTPTNDRGFVCCALRLALETLDDLDRAIESDTSIGMAYLKRALVHTLQGNDTVADREVASSVALGIDRGTLESLIESLVDGPKTWTGHCYYQRPRPPRIHSCSKLGSPRLDIRKTSR